MRHSFEDFLKDWHMKDYHGTDDAAPDAFEHWLSEIETDDLMKLASLYGKEMYIQGKEDVLERLSKPIMV